MTIRSVGDLQNFLKEKQRSPEEVAKVVGVSNMTIRRFLKKRSNVKISQKYWPLFDSLTLNPELILESIGSLGFEKLMEQVEKDGSNCKTPDLTRKQATEKAHCEALGSGIISLVRELVGAFKSKRSLKKQAIAVGALLYFLNPIDLIPDSIPVFGYLDDFAVMSLAVSMIRSEDAAKTLESKQKKATF